MQRVRVTLLGVPAIERDGVAITVDTRKATALLAYLAMAVGPQSRDVIASLLWSSLDTAGSRAALRRTLSTLKTALLDDALERNRDTLRLRRDALDLDVDRFQAALARVRGHRHTLRHGCQICLPVLLEAAAMYRSDFLTGFSLRNSPEFDDWQILQAEALRRLLSEALAGIVAALVAAERFEDAIEHARRWLVLDPFYESAHRALMELYQRAGQRSLAIRQYRECVRLLDEELAVMPAEETTRLYQSILECETLPLRASRQAAPIADLPDRTDLPLVGEGASGRRLCRPMGGSTRATR